jgi:DNA-binding response OmpR family regulator
MSQRIRNEVWVVEDDRSLLEGLLTLLSDNGYRTRGFTDPRRALRAARRAPPRVVVTDYRMPGLDGVELAKTLRDELGPSAPRLFLVSGERLRRVELTHFDQVLRKPFRFFDLLAMIERVLSGPRRTGSHRRLRRVTPVDPRAKPTGSDER